MRTGLLAIVAIGGCGTDGPGVVASNLCVGEQLDTTGAVAERTTQTFDDAGLLVQTDWIRFGTYNVVGKWTYDYDAQGRLIVTHRHGTSATDTGDDTNTTYESNRVTITFGGTETMVYDLQDGRLVHREGPMESPVAMRSIEDLGYDAQGRLITSASHAFDIDTNQMTSSTEAWSYDAMGRTMTVDRSTTEGGNTSQSTAMLTYVDRADGWAVSVAITDGFTQTGTFAVDATGRLVRSAIDEDGDGIDDWYATYAHDDAHATLDAVDVRTNPVAGPRRWQTQGRCGAPAVATAPSRGVALPVPAMDLSLPNPGASVLAL